MSKLGLLKIVGPVTPCNKTVRVQNQLIGANVVLTLKPPTGGVAISIGGGPASWPDESFTVTTLTPGHTIVAIQTMSGFTQSDEATLFVANGPKPLDLIQGTFAVPIHTCAQCIYLQGLWPGAEIEIQTSTGEGIGKAIVQEDGVVPVYLTRELANGEWLRALVRCGSVVAPSPIFASKASEPPGTPGTSLPAPTIDPATECDQYITISGIVPGAQVTVFRGGGIRYGPSCSPGGRLKFTGIKPLKKPDDNTIEATQDFPSDRCRLHSPKGSATLIDRSKLGPPQLPSPLCEGRTSVDLSDLHPGAQVELVVNGDTILFGAPDTVLLNYPVAPLMFPQTVTARQKTCDDPASWSPLRKEPVNASTPVPPNPYSPPNGATGVAANVTLKWSDPGGYCNHAASFEFQVSTAPNLSTIAYSQNLVTSLQWTIFPPLAPNTTYYWRVRSHRGSKTTGWSAIVKFTTIPQGQQPTSHDQPTPPGDERKERCFVEDCCPNYKRVIKQFGTYNEAYDKAVKAAPSGCNVEPLEVPCDTKVKPCGQP